MAPPSPQVNQDEPRAAANEDIIEVGRRRLRGASRWVGLAALGVVALIVLIRVRKILLLFLLALLFAYLISPLVQLLTRPWHIRRRTLVLPRVAAIALAYLVLLGTLAGASAVLVPQLVAQVNQLGHALPQLIGHFRPLFKHLYARFLAVPALQQAVDLAAGRGLDVASGFFTGLVSTTVALLGYVPWLALVPILGFFLLKDGTKMRRGFLETLPNEPLRNRVQSFFGDINAALAAYMRAQLFACCLVGTVCTVAFAAVGLPYWLVFGALAALLEFVPLLGPLTILVITTLVGLTHSTTTALANLIVLLTLRLVEDYVVYPRLVSRGLALPPLAIILSVLCGAELAGVIGIFLAVPALTTFVITYRHLRRNSPALSP